jgi:hypothetical protein
MHAVHIDNDSSNRVSSSRSEHTHRVITAAAAAVAHKV